MKLARDYENNAKKIARFKNHLRFNLHCKHNGITPTSLRITTSVKGPAADRIVTRAQRQLLNVRIGQTVRKLDQLERSKTQFEDEIHQKMPEREGVILTHVTELQL